MDENRKYRGNRYVRRKHRDLNTEEPGPIDSDDEAAPQESLEWSYLQEYSDYTPRPVHFDGVRKDEGIAAARKRRALKDTCYVCDLQVVKPILRASSLGLFLDSIPDTCSVGDGTYWVLGVSDFNPNTDAAYSTLKLYVATLNPMAVLEGFPVCKPPVRLQHHSTVLAEIPTPEWITT